MMPYEVHFKAIAGEESLPVEKGIDNKNKVLNMNLGDILYRQVLKIPGRFAMYKLYKKTIELTKYGYEIILYVSLTGGYCEYDPNIKGYVYYNEFGVQLVTDGTPPDTSLGISVN